MLVDEAPLTPRPWGKLPPLPLPLGGPDYRYNDNNDVDKVVEDRDCSEPSAPLQNIFFIFLIFINQYYIHFNIIHLHTTIAVRESTT